MAEIKRLIKKGEGKTIEFKKTLPDRIQIAKIIAGRSEIRNKVIARFFKEIEFIEQWGSGIRRMIRLLEENGLPVPHFQESGLFFKVIIYKRIKKSGDKTSDTEKTAKEIPKGTTIETSGEKSKKTRKVQAEKGIGTIRETTAITGEEITEGEKTMIETTTETSGEKSKKSRKVPPEKDIGTSGETTAITGEEITEGKKTRTETSIKTSGEKFKIPRKAPSKEAINTRREITSINKKEITTLTAEKLEQRIDSKTTRTILNIINKQPFIKASELGKQLRITESGARYHLAKLKKEGVLKRVGSTKSGYWKINEDRRSR